MQYGFHFLVLRRYSNFPISDCSLIDPFSMIRSILFRNCLSIVCNASGFIGALLRRLQINLASEVFLKGCLFNQSRTYGNEVVSKMGPPPVFVLCGISPSA